MQLTIFATTDVHGAIYPYNYFDNEEKSHSLLHVASYIEQYKQIHDALVLTVDNGDMLQGDTWNDYDVAHPDNALVPQVINSLYDVVGLGNHEFNYGFNHLTHMLSDYTVPVINSNIDFENPLKDIVENHYIKTVLVDKKPLNIGFVSVVPTQVTRWDHMHFRNDNSVVHPMYEAVQRTVATVKDKGADVIILLAHTGLNAATDKDNPHDENQAYLYAQFASELGIHAIVCGHTHEVFPSENTALDDETVDVEHGSINNVPIVQPGVSAKYLGKIDFELEFKSDEWCITKRSASIIQASEMQIDEALLKQYEAAHISVKNYLGAPITTLNTHWHTYFAQVLSSSAVQVTGEASKDFVERLIKGKKLPELPVLSFNAPTRGGRDGAHDYTNIPSGPLTLSDAINLYKHANTMSVLQINGATLREWLEWSASQFVTLGAPRLLAPNDSNTGFPSYNYDMFYDLDYEIDISNGPRYNNSGYKISDERRILSVKYNGKEVQADDQFLVAANNYRASNTPFLQGPETTVVYESSELVRDILIDYLQRQQTFVPRIPFTLHPERTYEFVTATEAAKLITDEPIRHVKTLEDGFSLYEVTYGNHKK